MGKSTISMAMASIVMLNDQRVSLLSMVVNEGIWKALLGTDNPQEFEMIDLPIQNGQFPLPGKITKGF